MSIVDLSQLDAPADSPQRLIETDVCIVGAGAAGITLALELARSGVRVVLLESGGVAPDNATQSLYDLDSSGYPLRQNYMSRARHLGGSCNLWAGRSMPLTDIDLRVRDWVPHSGWPIALAELSRWYGQAGEVLGLPALDAASLRDYENRMTRDEQALLADADFVATMSLWAPSPQRFGADFRARMKRAHSLTLFLNASVTRVDLDPAGARVVALEAATLAGGRLRVRAHHFVLACGGIENARLLLAANAGAGIGNDHDLVGRFFMDHPRAVLGKLHLPANRRLRAMRGRPLGDGKFQLGIGLSEQAQRRERMLNHYVTFEEQTSGYAEARYQSMVQTAKVLLRKGHSGSRWDFRSMKVADLPNMVYLLSPKELMPHWLYRLYVAGRDAMPRAPKAQTYIIVYFCEQPPDPLSRVTLGKERDALGMPRVNLHWHIHESVVASMLRMQELLAARFERSGVGRLEPGVAEQIAFTDASHHMGTTRMGATPQTAVVDENCRVHGVGNLYIAGSSVFPSAGYANPTLTIVALALRLAQHLQQAAERAAPGSGGAERPGQLT